MINLWDSQLKYRYLRMDKAKSEEGSGLQRKSQYLHA